MIILCPSCSDPFQLLPANIAPLVQVACPRCAYKIILDFEAANNPALREEGMYTTQGFRSADDYQKFVATHGLEGIRKQPLPEEKPVPSVHREPPTSPPVQPPTSIPPTSGKISPFHPAEQQAAQPTPAEESAAAQRIEEQLLSAPPSPEHEPVQTPLEIMQKEDRIGAGAILGVLIALLIALMLLSYFLRGSWNPLHLLNP